MFTPIIANYTDCYTTTVNADIASAYTCASQFCDDEIFSQPSVDHVVSIALSHESVIGARAFEWQGEIIVAVLTTPFYLKSERDKAKEEIECILAEETHSPSITVTFDVGVYRNIQDDMTDEEKQRLYARTTRTNQ